MDKPRFILVEPFPFLDFLDAERSANTKDSSRQNAIIAWPDYHDGNMHSSVPMVNLFRRFPLPSVAGRYRDILKRWDSGQQSVRYKILETFVQNHRGCTAPELESSLGNAASLFLARLVSSLGITYGKPCILFMYHALKPELGVVFHLDSLRQRI
jgi:hypothetical protein